MRLHDVLRKYVSEHPSLRPATRTGYLSVAAIFERNLPSAPIDRLTPSDLAHFRRNRLSQGKSPRTVNWEMSVAKMALSHAGQWHRFAGHSQPLKCGPSPGQALTHGQQQLLVTIAFSRRCWRAAADQIILALNTAMRLSEICGLQRQHVNLESDCALVARSKNGQARQIPLNNSARAVIERRLSEIPPAVNAPLFATDVRSSWLKIRALAGLKTLRFHDLRHTAISTLAHHGTPESVIREIAGHLDENMSRLYIHPHAEQIRAAVQSLAKPAPKARQDAPGSIAGPSLVFQYPPNQNRP